MKNLDFFLLFFTKEKKNLIFAKTMFMEQKQINFENNQEKKVRLKV
jgi:hypothetical protein